MVVAKVTSFCDMDSTKAYKFTQDVIYPDNQTTPTIPNLLDL